jgi:hypothetical protein
VSPKRLLVGRALYSHMRSSLTRLSALCSYSLWRGKGTGHLLASNLLILFRSHTSRLAAPAPGVGPPDAPRLAAG